ncbi:hypothetical protein [Intrasporangium sp. DVR]|uniref:hypothetical protein n=1 Tax=Intrasporangium sp. DVR TaxID=3127867 RepID=UPI00313A61D5
MSGWCRRYRVSFYGDRKTKLGIALDLVDQDGMPYAFAGERLQLRNGLPLRLRPGLL